ncbi:tRNA (adenosine(37)-N6)-threonylcarbamoyltransferase complex dimerization subunit type 1 TsaB [Brevundimonas staleyi]|uniref:tRNA (Adenosine(37)-N6)-threonylcarbamoyltransferase complex dimerization subunit type 1 TsaB n=1 Tax=Brevundimonas staleyi TaxID=74326 RepID=A0ABW0FY36_9CAUL
MRVLVIDTALDACTAAVFEDGRALGVRTELMARGHSERLGGFVRDAVAEAGGGFQSLDRIGVTVGPGSFTGLRVGLAFAQGLGAALDLPVVGISTLEALARSKEVQSSDLGVLAAIDARRGQIYFQSFHGDRADAPPEALDVDEACRRFLKPRSFSWSLVGSGAPLIAEALSRHWPETNPRSAKDEPFSSEALTSLIRNPTVEALAALTAAHDPATHPPTPLYLRAPDATPPTRLPGQARPAAVGA